MWENVRKGVTNKVNSANAAVRTLFWFALSAKAFLLRNSLPGAGLLDRVVFNKVKDATGGRLRICLSGGGPIAKETQHFISHVIAVLLNGYGLTETTR